jgi:transketolase
LIFMAGTVTQTRHPGKTGTGKAGTGKAGTGKAGTGKIGDPPLTLLATLIARHLRADPADPHWPDRDRLLLGSPTPAFSATSTGEGQWPGAPPGLAFGAAVGQAIAERLLAARFGRSLVDHRIWLTASHADLVCGAGREAAQIAGTLGLGRLALLATPPHDDRALREGFAAAGWAVRAIDARDPHAAETAFAACQRAHKPTLLLAIGAETPRDAPADAPLHPPPAVPGPPCAPNPGGLAASRHPGGPAASPNPGGPAASPNPGGPAASPNPRGPAARRAWLKRLRRHASREAFQNALAGRLPPGWQKACHPDAPYLPQHAATAEFIAALSRLAPILPELATLPLSEAPLLPPPHVTAFPAGALNRAARHREAPNREALDWEALDQAAPACLLGMSLHGGILPVSQARTTAELPRAAWRMAATLRARWLHTIAHDRPTPPLPELAIANLHVYQPADPGEAADCLALALRRTDGPSVLTLPADAEPHAPRAFPRPFDPDLDAQRTHPPRLDPRLDTARLDASRPDAPQPDHQRLDHQRLGAPRPDAKRLGAPVPDAPRSCARGAYLVHAPLSRDLTLLAAGPALSVAATVRALLTRHGLIAALVSMPCRALWDAQDTEYRHAVLGSAPIVAFAADVLAFAGLTGPRDLIIGCQFWPPDPHASVAAILRRYSAP